MSTITLACGHVISGDVISVCAVYHPGQPQCIWCDECKGWQAPVARDLTDKIGE